MDTVEKRDFDLTDCQFTIVEASKHLRISRSFLYSLIANKKIRPIKLGKRTLVPGVEIRRFMQTLRQ
jgi:excisionase family DNA binding protein